VLEPLAVAAIVIACAIYALRSLTPFRARVALARALSGRVPDRVLIWLAGQTACQACGSRPTPVIKR
jgi:hypothetical protein